MSARRHLIQSLVIRRSLPLGLRPGLRAGVLFMCSLLVVGAAVAVSANVSDHLAKAAVDEAVASTEAVVRGLVDPMIKSAGVATLTSGEALAIDDELEHLVGSGKILRIKVWAADGTVVASDLAALRGMRFPVDDDLTEAFEGYITVSLKEEIDRIADYYGERYGAFWVAVGGEQLVGMFGLEPSSRDAMELRRMYVDRAARPAIESTASM